MPWKVLGFVDFYEKFWKSPGILHNICVINFLFQLVDNSSCQFVIQYILQVFPLFIYLFLELKHKKCCSLLSRNYFLFAFDRKYLKIIAFSKMNSSGFGLGKKMKLLQYAIIALKMSVLPIWKRLL